MPYILQYRRESLPNFEFERFESAGELNYVLTMAVQRYIKCCGGASYTAINEAIGALECAKMELYRRLAVPYEDKKIIQNGDVYVG